MPVQRKANVAPTDLGASSPASTQQRIGSRTRRVAPSTEEPSTLRKFLAGGTRVAATLAGSPLALIPGIGTAGAFGVGAAGELAAEAIEGSLDASSSWKRAGVEGVLNAIPLGAVVKGGRVVQSAVKSGLMSGVGDVARQNARGEEFSPASTVYATALGAGTGGLLGRFTKAAPVKAPVAKPNQINNLDDFLFGRSHKEIEDLATKTHHMGYPEGATELRRAATIGMKAGPRTVHMLEKAELKAAKAAEAKTKLQTADDQLDEMMAEGLEPGPASITESYTSGARKGSRRYTKPRGEEDLDNMDGGPGLVGASSRPPGGPSRAPAADATLEVGARVTPEAAGGLDAVARFFRSRVDALGEGNPFGYQATQAAEQAGTLPINPMGLGASGGKPVTASRILGQGLRREAQEAGLPTGRAVGSVTGSDASTGAPRGSRGGSRTTQNADAAARRHGGDLVTSPEDSSLRATLADAGWPPNDIEDYIRDFNKTAGIKPRELIEAPAGFKPAVEVTPSGPVPTVGVKTTTLPPSASQTRAPRKAKAAASPPIPKMSPGGTPKAATGPSQDAKDFYSAKAEPEASAKPAFDDKPRLVPEGGTGSGTLSSIGSFAGMMDLVQKQPELAVQLGLGAAGGAGMAIADPFNDPLASGMVGFGAGFMAPSAVKGFRNAGGPEYLESLSDKMSTPSKAWDATKQAARFAPNFARFNYLADIKGLLANALVGPYAAGALSAATKAAAGDPRGMVALRQFANVKNVGQKMAAGREEALSLIESGELGRAEMGASGEFLPKIAKEVMQGPGVALTAGDVGIRNVLLEAGFTPDEARIMTMTNEPELGLPKGIVDFGKNSALAQFLLPFRRTPANILEQGAHHTPGLGFLTQALREGGGDPLREQVAQQVVGTAAGAGGYAAGANVDPETARYLRRFVANAGGRAGALSGFGFAMGQASHRGPGGINAGEVQRGIESMFPLPTTDPITDLTRTAMTGKMPRFMLPGDVYDSMYPPAKAAVRRTTGVRRKR